MSLAALAGLGARFAGISILNPWVLLGAALAAGAIAAGSGKLAYHYATAQCKSAEADRRALADEIRSDNLDFANLVASRTEAAIGKIRVNHRTVIQPEIRHEREIHKVLQDPNCAVPPSTIRLLNTARGHIDRGPPAGEPDRPVRAPDAPGDQPPAPPR